MVADSKFGERFSLIKIWYDTWYSGLKRLFKIFDNNTGIHNMLKYKHNTFKRKIKVYTKAFYKNKWSSIIYKNEYAIYHREVQMIVLK
jgi:hypothetical protein